MRNLKLTLAYDGADFRGWQVQPGRPTVQGLLAAALERVTGERVLPQGSGRTDAGVHALAQVASCALASPIPAANLVIALNDLLPPAVRVLRVEEAAPGFHARKSAQAKTYRYRTYRGDICPPFLARYVCHHPYPLDEAAMTAAAAEFRGEHDFTSFAAVDAERGREEEPPRMNADERGSEQGESVPVSAVGSRVNSNVRTIYASELRREGAELIYEIRGSGFLHHMVRNIVGLLLLVGKGTARPVDVARILAARNRSANPGATAPACGLYLVGVEYD
jgi:tRNA pseudouridine38-40 synthase